MLKGGSTRRKKLLASPLHEACVNITCAVCHIKLSVREPLCILGSDQVTGELSGRLRRRCLIYDEHCNTHITVWSIKGLVSLCRSRPLLALRIDRFERAIFVSHKNLVVSFFLYAFSTHQSQLELVGTLVMMAG